jgi:hypothetical protein
VGSIIICEKNEQQVPHHRRSAVSVQRLEKINASSSEAMKLAAIFFALIADRCQP